MSVLSLEEKETAQLHTLLSVHELNNMLWDQRQTSKVIRDTDHDVLLSHSHLKTEELAVKSVFYIILIIILE